MGFTPPPSLSRVSHCASCHVGYKCTHLSSRPCSWRTCWLAGAVRKHSVLERGPTDKHYDSARFRPENRSQLSSYPGQLSISHSVPSFTAQALDAAVRLRWYIGLFLSVFCASRETAVTLLGKYVAKGEGNGLMFPPHVCLQSRKAGLD